MPNYSFECKKCECVFEEICSYSDCESKFPDVRCPECKSKSLNKNVMGGRCAEVIFDKPRESSKWDNWSYRQGKTMEEAKQCRANAEVKEGQTMPREYQKKLDDTNNGRRMNFID